MRWTIHGERALYESPWVSLTLADVELPDGTRFEHHVVRSAAPAVGCILHDPDRGVLLLWRHRFIPDEWGWEIPAGRVEKGETLAQAAAREALEETGWRPGRLTKLTTYRSAIGLSDQLFGVFLGTDVVHEGDPVDAHESERLEWIPVDRLRRIVTSGEMPDGLSLTGVLWALTQNLI